MYINTDEKYMPFKDISCFECLPSNELFKVSPPVEGHHQKFFYKTQGLIFNSNEFLGYVIFATYIFTIYDFWIFLSQFTL